MKIVINSLPRSGTKLLECNFQSYLKSLDIPIMHPERVYGVGEPFHFNDQDLLTKSTMYRMQIENDQSFLFLKNKKGDPKSLNDELLTRAEQLLKINLGWVLKRTPFLWFDPIIYELSMRTKSVAIIRKDIFSHALSFSIAKHLNIWCSGTDLTNEIELCKNNKITINSREFLHIFKWFKGFNNFKWSSDIQVVKFEEMVTIDNSEDFCNFFKIPVLDFSFDKFELEYGDNKFDIVANLDELRTLSKQC